MSKKRLKILGLSYSPGEHSSYILVLSEVKGDRKLPIIIKPNDAQVIGLKLEDTKTQRPLTHDLFKSVNESFGIEVQEIYIKNIAEGIFYPKVIFNNVITTKELDCSVSDAVILSITHKCPIYASEDVLKIAGIHMDDQGRITEEQNEINHNEDRTVKNSIEALEKMLQTALDNEEYEVASQLRDKIKERKSEG